MNKGFIATSLIYSFFLVIVLFMTLTINNTLQTSRTLTKYSEKAKEETISNTPETASEGKPLTEYLNILGKEYSKNSTNILVMKEAPKNLSCTYTLAYDNTNDDNNLRYVGFEPCNYVTFNGEEAGWRIVGIFNNIDAQGTKKTLIKLVRRDSIGEFHIDDKNKSRQNFSSSKLATELNSDYLTYKSGTTYWNYNNFDHKLAIKPEYLDMIEKVTWNTGCAKYSDKAASLYQNERGTIVPDGFTNTFEGKIGLLYPSDYAFAIGETNEIRTKCLSMDSGEDLRASSWAYSCGTGSGCDKLEMCYYHNWLNKMNTLTITTVDDFYDSTKYYPFVITAYWLDMNRTANVRPALFLSSNVLYDGGMGTKDDPIRLKK